MFLSSVLAFGESSRDNGFFQILLKRKSVNINEIKGQLSTFISPESFLTRIAANTCETTD